MDHLAACQVCASSALREVTRIKDHSVSQESFGIVACAACGAWFTSPRPGPDSIGAYYQSTKYISHTNASTSFLDRIYQLVRKRTLASKHRIISSYRTNGRLLDIGCGTGQFALFMKRKGYQVSGVEPDAGARSQASTILEHTVHASIEVLPSGSNYDLITMWHVLEHVPDLQPTFASLNHLLARGGHLLIAIPDRESWDARHYGEAWAAYDVPRHLSHLRRQIIPPPIRPTRLRASAHPADVLRRLLHRATQRTIRRKKRSQSVPEGWAGWDILQLGLLDFISPHVEHDVHRSETMSPGKASESTSAAVSGPR